MIANQWRSCTPPDVRRRPALHLLVAIVTMFFQTNAAPAKNLQDEAPTAEWLEIDAKEPISVRIHGRVLELVPTAGFMADIALNAEAASPLGLSGATPGTYLTYARRNILRHGFTNTGVVINGRTAFRNVRWVPGFDGLPRQGVIDLKALPARRIRVHLGSGAQSSESLRLPLDRDGKTNAIARTEDGKTFNLLAQIHSTLRLPKVSASLAVDLAESHGGQLQGAAWQEDVGFGQYRLVRQLTLARPLILGPLRLANLAVDITPTSDASTRLAKDQKPLPDADADPNEMTVRGRTAVTTFPGRWIVLSRNQLDEYQCTSLTVDKSKREWALTCARSAES